MNPFRTPIRFWWADWKHERWMKKLNKKNHKEGFHMAILPPSKMVGKKVIMQIRGQPGHYFEMEITK